jgi:ABC-type proline/glycine betaine transport system substrate-binding protein
VESIFFDECTAAGSAFDLPPCNCLGDAKPAAFDDRPVITIVLGDFLSAAVDARLLKTVVEEILGFPARLVSYAGDCQSTWAALASGEAHIWPEVWRTEEDGEYYTEYVIRRRSVGTAGALGIIGRNGCADFAQPVWHGTVLGGACQRNLSV